MRALRPDTKWTQDAIDALAVEDHFRLRGTDTTRLDTLVDAAFAFTLTMLVITFDGVPNSFDEIIDGLLHLPALVVSFAVLMMFWFGHRKWSRRYGIEDAATIMASVSLVFVLLVYIYPLRLIFEGMFTFLSGGRLPWTLNFTSFAQVRGFFAFYAAGFLAMSTLMCALYFFAKRKADDLLLDSFERLETQFEFHRWLAAIVFSILSMLIALFIPIQFVSMSGFIFFGLFGYTAMVARQHKKNIAAL
ncbi:MAG: TMEM175 family protein [Pseudomonadota bacterium]